MKSATLSLFYISVLFFFSCNNSNETGTLIFKGAPSLADQVSATMLRNADDSNIHEMYTTKVNFFVTELWVSRELVSDGIVDNFKWYKIGEGDELKPVEDYSFTKNDLPIGEYKSFKMVMKNVFSRTTVYTSDLSKTIEMTSSLGEDGCGDETLITLYFSKMGNHSLVDGRFHLDSRGENIRGFKIKEGEVTTIFWRTGNPDTKMTDCTFEWVDVNNNNIWDCGIDRTQNTNCIVETAMFSFSVDDGEPEPYIRDAVTDIDGNKYDAVIINDKIWMQENLRTTRLKDGQYLQTWEEYRDSLKNLPPSAPTEAPIRSMQNNSDSLFAIYGGLYSKLTVLTGKLCPVGWHVPTDEEWLALSEYLGDNAGGKLKTAEGNWWSPNEGATNEYLFSAMPGGALMLPNSFSDNGAYTGYGQWAYFWSSTRGNSESYIIPALFIRKLSFDNGNLAKEVINDNSHLSCRCVKD